MDHVMHEVSAHMGGGEKPKKEIHHIEIHKSATKGDHHIIHKHTSAQHPDEHHTTRGDDELAAHTLATMGTPNPGETADTGPAGPATSPDATAGAAAGAAPNAAAGAPPMAAM